MLQFPTGRAEAVEQVVLSGAVDPLPTGGQYTRHKVTTLTLTGAECTDNLQQVIKTMKQQLRMLRITHLSLNIH